MNISIQATELSLQELEGLKNFAETNNVKLENALGLLLETVTSQKARLERAKDVPLTTLKECYDLIILNEAALDVYKDSRHSLSYFAECYEIVEQAMRQYPETFKRDFKDYVALRRKSIEVGNVGLAEYTNYDDVYDLVYRDI